MNSRNHTAVSAILFLVLISLAVGTSRATGDSDGLLRVYFLNVGQGDAIFIQAPNGNQVLIDGGPDDSIIAELNRVMPFYDRTIDVVVATHPHADHIRGLSEVLQRYEVGTIIDSGVAYDSVEFSTWMDAVKNEGATYMTAHVGQQFNLGLEAVLSIIHPLSAAPTTVSKEPHDFMVVSMLKYKEFKMLLTGDMESDVERMLVTRGSEIDSDVLKVGHHGSSTSTSVSFLNAVSPQTAIIQVGSKNRYRHPAPAVVTRLENNLVKQYRTDTDGAVVLMSNGDTFTVEPLK